MQIRHTSAGLAVSLLFSVIAVVAAQQNQPGLVFLGELSAAQAQSTQDYWTEERMANATPMTPPTRLVENLPAQQNLPVVSGDPGFVNGWQPGSGPYVEQKQTFPRASMSGVGNPQAFGVPPTNPLNGPYGPFQRWTMQGTYLPWPRAIHGKFFFSFGASNFVCSASVIGRSTIATAGHCISNGNGTTATNMMFCPSYNQGGVNPQRGCWAVVGQWTTSAWHHNADADSDYACGIMHTSGTVIAAGMNKPQPTRELVVAHAKPNGVRVV